MGSGLGDGLAGRRALVIRTLLDNWSAMSLRLGGQLGGLADLGLDLAGHGRMGLQKIPRGLASLADALSPIREPGPALVDDLPVPTHVDELASLGDALGE